MCRQLEAANQRREEQPKKHLSIKESALHERAYLFLICLLTQFLLPQTHFLKVALLLLLFYTYNIDLPFCKQAYFDIEHPVFFSPSFSRKGQYRYKPGTTALLTNTVTPFSLAVVDKSVQIMDTE